MKKPACRKKSFRNDEQGVVAVFIAVTLIVVIFGILALSIDMNRTQTSYGDMQGSTDAAAYGTAEWMLKNFINNMSNNQPWSPSVGDVTKVDIGQYALKILQSNFQRDNDIASFSPDTMTAGQSNFTVTHTIQGDGNRDVVQHIVTVTACADLSDQFADAAEMTNKPDKEADKDTRVCTTSRAMFELGRLRNTDVAFALDYTESMYWKGEAQNCPPNTVNDISNCPPYEATKAYHLKTAMDSVFDTYFSTNPEFNSFASIVPFAGAVNIYPYNKTIKMVEGNPDSITFEKHADSPSPALSHLAMDDFYLPEGNADLGYNSYKKRVETVKINDKDHTHSYLMWFTNEVFKAPDYFTDTRDFTTKDYTYVLKRFPAFDKDVFNDILDSSKSGADVELKSYYDLVENLKSEKVVVDSGRYSQRQSITISSYQEENARMRCYMGAIGSGLDQRIERIESASTDYDAGGIVRTSPYESMLYGGKDLELHESFPIQPLTNNLPILKGTIKRFTEGSYLYPNDYPFNDPSPPDINRVVDGQTSRLNKSRWFSANTKTFSPAGLMWAWFTISHNWQGQWGVKSVSEEYFGGSVPDRSLSAGNPLPLADNAKHIVLITDGFDNDGQEAKTGPTATTTGVLEGYYNACDSYMPVTSFVDPDALPSDSDNYQKLCKKIRDEGIRIHIILYGIDVAVDDKRVKKYRACAGNTGDLYINPTPNQLSASFNTIFSKILADGVQVRLIH